MRDARNGAMPDLAPYPPADSYADEFAAATLPTERKAEKSLKQLPYRLLCDVLANPHMPRWLIPKILEVGVVALLVGRRGTYKSFIALDWTLRSAKLGYAALIISPEGAGLSNRIAAWLQHHGPDVDPKELKICVVEIRVDLIDPAVVELLHNTIAAWGEQPAIILVDTVSKNSGRLDENSNSEVKAFIGVLDTELRTRYGAAVLAVHHTGHDNLGRARGASAFEADVEALYIVTREGISKTVTVSRERFKDSEELPPLAYEATVIDLGRFDEEGNPVTSLALNSTDAPPVKSKAKGKNQESAIVALREWARSHADVEIISTIEVTALFKSQKIPAKRKPEVLNFLVNAGVLIASIGGHKINRGAL